MLRASFIHMTLESFSILSSMNGCTLCDCVEGELVEGFAMHGGGRGVINERCI
jgi:hypothetical protein